MKKINQLFDKNIEKILIIFLWIQPFIDLITSMMVKNVSLPITFGIVIRGLFLLFLFYYTIIFLKDTITKWERLYLLSVLLYMVIYFANILIFKNFNAVFVEFKYLFKAFYFPILLFLIYIIRERKNVKIRMKDLIIPAVIYVSSIFIFELSKLGYLNYGSSRIINEGLFYAANEVSSIIAILFPLFLSCIIKSKSKILNFIILIIYILVSLIIGTKVSFFGIAFTLIGFGIYYLYLFFKSKQKKNLKTFIYPIVFSIVLIFLVYPYSPISNNIKYHLKLVNIGSISEFFGLKNVNEIKENNEEVINNESQNDDFDNADGYDNNNNSNDVYSKPNSLNFILSSRDKYLEETNRLYKNSNIWLKLFGIGYIENFGTSEQKIETIEMDFFDILFRFGIVGIILYFSFVALLIILFIKKNFTNFLKELCNSKIVGLIFALLLGFGISFVAGHVLTAPSVSIYLVYMFLVLYVELTEKKDLNKNKRIWIDVTNSPHSILFNPIIKKLKKNGYEIILTARDYAQTIGLLDMFKIDYTLIGDHKGKSKIKKLWGLFERSWQLYWFARDKNFDASLSMSSQTCMIASKILRIPHMTLYDYEYTNGHHIDFRLSKQILTPEGVEEKTLRHYGAKMKNVIFFPGLKEQFYIDHYMKEFNSKYKGKNPLKEKFQIENDRILIVVRPEATVAHYQSNENNLCFDLVEYLSKHKNKPIIIVLPRIKSQKEDYKNKKYKNVIIPDDVINGIELVASADLVIGAGGTVNREAAAIGVPVYTIYQGGKFCAVDRMLISTNRMIRIKDKKDFKNIVIEKNNKKPKPVGIDLSDFYVEMVNKLVENK